MLYAVMPVTFMPHQTLQQFISVWICRQKSSESFSHKSFCFYNIYQNSYGISDSSFRDFVLWRCYIAIL